MLATFIVLMAALWKSVVLHWTMPMSVTQVHSVFLPGHPLLVTFILSFLRVTECPLELHLSHQDYRWVPEVGTDSNLNTLFREVPHNCFCLQFIKETQISCDHHHLSNSTFVVAVFAVVCLAVQQGYRRILARELVIYVARS